MRIALDHHSPFILAHGGFAAQIRSTYDALRHAGLDASYLRWWDDGSHPDLIHYFGPCPAWYLRFAREQRIKTVVTQLHGTLGSRPAWRNRLQGLVIGTIQRLVPPVAARLGWDSYALADAIIALTPHEARLIRTVFHAPPSRVHVVGNAVDDAFHATEPLPREDWLLSTAAITERKRVCELALASTLAGVRLKIFGRPYSESDSYHRQFLQAVEQSNGLVEWCGEISDRAGLASVYRRAKGFVLPSTEESLSLSALEAAACQCPLLLTDLPWAMETFGDAATYLQNSGNLQTMAESLRNFAEAPRPPTGFAVPTWREIATRLSALYQAL